LAGLYYCNRKGTVSSSKAVKLSPFLGKTKESKEKPQGKFAGSLLRGFLLFSKQAGRGQIRFLYMALSSHPKFTQSSERGSILAKTAKLFATGRLRAGKKVTHKGVGNG
jgi:hypothetical protein